MMNTRFISGQLLSIVFFACIGVCVCAADSTEVAWTPAWKAGDQFTVELVKERAPANAEANKGRVRLDISIQEKGKDFYVLHCTYGKFEMEGPQKNNPLVAKMTNLSEGLCLKIKTGEDGLPNEVINIDEVIEKMAKTIDTLEEFLKENKLPQAMIEQAVSPIRAMYRQPESAQRAMLKDLPIFFLFCGAKLELGNVSEFDELLPNPLQGEPLPGKGTILLKEFDTRTGIAVIEYRMTIDKERAAPILLAAMKKMVPQTPSLTAAEMPEIDLSDQALYRIDTKKGWPLSVEHSRDIKTNGQSKRVQSLSFKTIKEGQ